jgi:hypothetical protein
MINQLVIKIKGYIMQYNALLYDYCISGQTNDLAIFH